MLFIAFMQAITSHRMAAIDANCEYLGIKRLQLMENAGASVARAVKRMLDHGKVVVFAGRGNNGGDAFVAARHLSNYDIVVILLGRKQEIKTQEARHNWNVLENTTIPLIEVKDSTQLEQSLIKDADIIIDGIFGTGIRGRIKQPESKAIDIINKSDAFVVSIDIPSGFDPDGGEFEKSVIANLTLTFHRMKKGLLSKNACKYAGKIEVVDIGIPKEAEFFVGPGDVMNMKRPASSHKGDAGKLLVIGGGAYSGAPALCAMAALRTGADIVTVAVPETVYEIVASFSPNLIVKPLSGDILTEENIPLISDLIEKHDVVVMGMGLGKAEETKQAIKRIIKLCKKAVIDADALIPEILPVNNNNIIITPHAGEMKRLSGYALPEDEFHKYEFIKNFARENKVIVLLKGNIDIISNGVELRANKTGNAGMTVGGTGDVLAGVTGALLAKHDAFEAACAGAFINGKAGDMAFEDFGYGLLATDVINKIPEVIRDVHPY